MRKDKVITFHRVQVKEDFAEDHPCYPWRGKEGTIQLPPLPYVLPGDYVPVKLDGYDTRFIFEAAHLDDLTKPLPDVGDIVSIKAKVISRQDEGILVAAYHSETGRANNWMDRSDVQYVMERAEKVEPEELAEEEKTFRFRGTYTHPDYPPVIHYVTLEARSFDRATKYFTHTLPASLRSLEDYSLVSVSLI